MPCKAFVAVAIFLCLLFSQKSHAQQKPLGSELGMRFSTQQAVTYRFFHREDAGFELIFTKTGPSLLFSCLYERFLPLTYYGLYAYYGYGGSLGARNQQLQSAIDLQLGTVYYLPFAPFSVDFAFRPYAVITGSAGVNAELAVSARWVF
jgi:hypothetical protein